MDSSLAPEDSVLRTLLAGRPLIALVGASTRPERPSHSVMGRLLEWGYEVIPVNPNERSVLGQPCYPDLYAIPRRVGLVDVFRRSEATPPVARAAAEVGARTLWLQVGVVNDEAAAIARAAGLTVVMDRCMAIEHERLLGSGSESLLPGAGPATGPAGSAGASEPRGTSGAAGPPPDPVGLCRDCRYSREVPTRKITYWLCRRSEADAAFPRYPRLPINSCRGFVWKEVAAADG